MMCSAYWRCRFCVASRGFPRPRPLPRRGLVVAWLECLVEILEAMAGEVLSVCWAGMKEIFVEQVVNDFRQLVPEHRQPRLGRRCSHQNIRDSRDRLANRHLVPER